MLRWKDVQVILLQKIGYFDQTRDEKMYKKFFNKKQVSRDTFEWLRAIN